MKKFKGKICAIFASIIAIFGCGVASVSANAETVETTNPTTESIAYTENIEDSAGKNTSIEDVFDFAEEKAEKLGLSEEWDAVIENLKNAADAKKVDLMTGVSIAQLVTLIAYIIGKSIISSIKKKNDTIKSDVKTTKTAVGNQTKALNELIVEEEHIADEMKCAVTREKNLAIAGQEQNAALRCLFRGIQLKQDIKEEAFRHLNNADEFYDAAKK